MSPEDRKLLELAAKADRVDAVIEWLRPIAEPVAKEAEFSRWISARNAASPDQSEDWCTACARAEVARLNEANPDHEYLVDGGWGSPMDCPPYCCKCGKTLSDDLTKYAIADEADHYTRHSVSLRCQHAAEKAFRFIEVFESPSFDQADRDAWKFFLKVERMHKRSATRAAAAIGEAMP